MLKKRTAKNAKGAKKELRKANTPKFLTGRTSGLCHKFWKVGGINHVPKRSYTKEEFLGRELTKINDINY